MSRETEKAAQIVRRLVMQYQEYFSLMRERQSAETEKLASMMALAKTRALSLADVKANEAAYPEIAERNRRIALVTREMEQLSDEMTFANPLVWMTYKDLAYRGTPQEMRDWAAFKEHCAPEAAICGRRYRAVAGHFQNVGMDFDAMWPDTMSLAQVCADRRILGLLNDLAFMEHWQEQEYRRAGGVIDKWGLKRAS